MQLSFTGREQRRWPIRSTTGGEGDKTLCRLKGMVKRKGKKNNLRNIKCCHKSKDNPENRRSILVQMIDIHL
jgi:hypothetical protein